MPGSLVLVNYKGQGRSDRRVEEGWTGRAGCPWTLHPGTHRFPKGSGCHWRALSWGG